MARKWMIAVGALLLVLATGFLLATRKLPALVHDRIIAALEDHFESRVELKNLDVVLFPSARITASGLVLKHKTLTDVPPLIMIDQLTAETSVRELLRNPTRLSRVRLQGLKIHVMAHKLRSGEERASRAGKKSPRFLIDEVIADGAVLET